MLVLSMHLNKLHLEPAGRTDLPIWLYVLSPRVWYNNRRGALLRPPYADNWRILWLLCYALMSSYSKHCRKLADKTTSCCLLSSYVLVLSLMSLQFPSTSLKCSYSLSLSLGRRFFCSRPSSVQTLNAGNNRLSESLSLLQRSAIASAWADRRGWRAFPQGLTLKCSIWKYLGF